MTEYIAINDKEEIIASSDNFYVCKAQAEDSGESYSVYRRCDE